MLNKPIPNSAYITRVRARLLALALLEDEHGISEEAFDLLCPLLSATNSGDIIRATNRDEGTVWLPEEVVTRFRKTLPSEKPVKSLTSK